MHNPTDIHKNYSALSTPELATLRAGVERCRAGGYDGRLTFLELSVRLQVIANILAARNRQ